MTLDALAPLALAIRNDSSLEQIIITSLAEYSAPAGAPPARSTARCGLSDLLDDVPEPRYVRVAIDADDLAVLQYTGGTTGAPKAAMLTHANIFANVVQTEAFMYRSRERGVARYLMVIPYFHIYGFTVGMMKGIWVGALQVLIPKYDVEQVLAALRDYRPTYFPAVPTIFVSLLSHPRVKEFGLEKVRTFNSGAAPCPVEVIEQFERTFGRTAQRRLRAVGSLAGDPHDAAARRPQDRHDRPAAARHRHEDRRSRDGDARAADRRGRRAVHLPGRR